MKTFWVARRDGRIGASERSRDCAHGSAVWSLPETRLEPSSAARYVLRGDVEPEEWALRLDDGEATGGDENEASCGERGEGRGVQEGCGEGGKEGRGDQEGWVDEEALFARFDAGEVCLAPELSHALRAASTASGTGSASAGAARILDWEVAPGVRMAAFRTPTLLPATHTNSFLLDAPDSDHVVLVEPAPHDEAEIDRLVQWAQRSGKPVAAMVVTHHHTDHVGALAQLRERLGTVLWSHPVTAERLGERAARLLADGDALHVGSRSWRVLATPGHAPGHVCLYDAAAGTLIAGDMVAGTGTILIEPGDGDMGAYLHSLARLAALTPTLSKVLPAHGGLIVGAEIFTRYAAHRRAREAKVWAALVAVGVADVGSLVPQAYDDVPKAVWPLAALSVTAHLEHLRAQGKARLTDAGWCADGVG